MSGKRSAVNFSEFRAMRKHLIKLDKLDERRYYQQALQKAKDVAAMLKEHYGVKQVYLYGSLAWGIRPAFRYRSLPGRFSRKLLEGLQ